MSFFIQTSNSQIQVLLRIQDIVNDFFLLKLICPSYQYLEILEFLKGLYYIFIIFSLF